MRIARSDGASIALALGVVLLGAAHYHRDSARAALPIRSSAIVADHFRYPEPGALAMDLSWSEGSHYADLLGEWFARRRRRVDELLAGQRPDAERARIFNEQSVVDTDWLIRHFDNVVAGRIIARVPLRRLDPITLQWITVDLRGRRIDP